MSFELPVKVEVSAELLEQLDEWSMPVRVRIVKEDGRYVMHAQTVVHHDETICLC